MNRVFGICSYWVIGFPAEGFSASPLCVCAGRRFQPSVSLRAVRISAAAAGGEGTEMSLSSSDRLSVRFSAANINSSGIARTAFRAISSYCKNGEGYSFSGIPLAFRACFPRAALLGAGHTPPAASLAAVADRYVDVSDPGFHAAKIRRIFLCRKGTGDFVLRFSVFPVLPAGTPLRHAPCAVGRICCRSENNTGVIRSSY